MKASLVRLEQEAANITTFFFRPERPLRYTAGQFIELTLPHPDPDDRGVKRWFTVSSAPGHELITITTKHADKPSSFKKELWQLEPGAEVDISEPMGDFVLPKDASRQLVFIAGGIGITPYHSIVQWLLQTHQTRPIQFIYSVHSDDELVFRSTFDQPFIERCELIGGEKLTATEINTLVGGLDQKQLFISGPEPMTEALVEQFKTSYGLNQDQLITDYFPGYPA